MSLLEVDHVSKRFGSLAAVRDVSLSVAPGELRAIIGPNGAGKTTLFNLVTGLFAPTSGTIRLAGTDISALKPQQRVALGIARTFQVTEIFPELTVGENLRVAVEIAEGFRLRAWLSARERQRVRDRIAELAEQVGLAAKRDRFVGELSHGDQRAAEIGLALALKPRLLLLDEPTAGMGDQETYEITALMSRLHRELGQTIVLIEHDMRVVFHLADRIAVLDQGEVLADGTPREIAADEAVQAAYLGRVA
jgi:branched-chain amino acid transport system ATP-binding protein